MNKFSIKKTGSVVGVISMIFFLLCMLWGIVLTDPILKELHLDILRIVYPGFSMSIVGVIIGIVEGFIYGLFFGALFSWLFRKVC